MAGQPSDEYKALQTQLNKSREENRALQKQLLDQAKVMASLERLEDYVLSDPSEDEADDRAASFKARRTKEQAGLQTRTALIDLLEKNDTDWSNPRLEGARSLWDAGDYEGAEKAAKGVLGVGGGTGDSDIEARVAAEVQKALKSRGLGDTGEGTGGSIFPSTAAELDAHLRDRSPAGQKWWTENKEAIMSEVAAGKIK